MPEEENEVMQEEGKKRTRRTPEQIAEAIDAEIEDLKESIQKVEEKKKASIAKFDKKIEDIKDKIKDLEAKKKTTLAPKAERKPRKTKKRKMEALLKQAEKAGLTPEAMAELLGLSLSE